MYCHQTNCHNAAEKKCCDCKEFFCRSDITNITLRRDKASEYVCHNCLALREADASGVPK